jgi:hypothetical protein
LVAAATCVIQESSEKIDAGASFVIQDSHTGDWELAIKNLALSNDEDGLHTAYNHSTAWIQVVNAHGLERDL